MAPGNLEPALGWWGTARLAHANPEGFMQPAAVEPLPPAAW